MPPGPAEPAAARNFATTASTRSGSSPTISAPSSSTALFKVPVSAPPKYVTPTPTTSSSVSTCKVTIGRVPFGFSAASASGSSAGSATIPERIVVIFIAGPQSLKRQELHSRPDKGSTHIGPQRLGFRKGRAAKRLLILREENRQSSALPVLHAGVTPPAARSSGLRRSSVGRRLVAALLAGVDGEVRPLTYVDPGLTDGRSLTLTWGPDDCTRPGNQAASAVDKSKEENLCRIHAVPPVRAKRMPG